MLVHQAFRFELDPNDVARSALASHAGAARYAYNWALALVLDRIQGHRVLAALAVRQGAGLDEARAWADEVGGPAPWTLPALRREWNRAKAEVAPWWAQNSKEAYNSGLDALARGLDAWLKSRRGQRRGPKVGFPRFHRRGTRRSFRVTTGSFGVLDPRHVRLPRIGAIRTKEPTSKLGRRLASGTARVLSATVSESTGRWYVAFGCEVEREESEGGRSRHLVVGVDVGVASLAVLSTGEVVPNPRHLGRYARRMARLQRECSRRRGPGSTRGPSKRWRRTKARLGRAHAKVAAARGDGVHKLTTALATGYDTVVVEDLNVRRHDGHGEGLGPLAGQGRAQQGGARRRPGRAAPPTGLQVRLVRLHPGGGRSVVPVVEDVLGLRTAKAKPVPGRAHLPLRGPGLCQPPRHRPGPQRSHQPGRPRRGGQRYREWPGNRPGRSGKRTGRREVHGLAQVLVDEPSRRHRLHAGQDRHRHLATGGSGARSHRTDEVDFGTVAPGLQRHLGVDVELGIGVCRDQERGPVEREQGFGSRVCTEPARQPPAEEVAMLLGSVRRRCRILSPRALCDRR